jgi:hypothetical protein
VDSLLYLSYGQGPHVDQLVYSVLSALHLVDREQNKCRIIVYTDDPDVLGDLPVHLERLNAKVLTEWGGPFGFIHRRKILAIKDALQKFGGRLGYCDCDTYFLKNPSKLFGRIHPGCTAMHIMEGNLYDSHAAPLGNFLRDHDLRHLSGQRWNITPDTPMFNAGVIGLHEADISMLDEVLHLTDQIYPHVRRDTIEQFAFSACFQQYTKLRQSYDIVHHYWPTPGRALFNEELRRVLGDPSISSQEERFRRLLPHQPCQGISYNRHSVTTGRRMRRVISRVAQRNSVFQALKRMIAGAKSFNQRRYRAWYKIRHH